MGGWGWWVERDGGLEFKVGTICDFWLLGSRERGNAISDLSGWWVCADATRPERNNSNIKEHTEQRQMLTLATCSVHVPSPSPPPLPYYDSSVSLSSRSKITNRKTSSGFFFFFFFFLILMGLKIFNKCHTE